MVGTQEFNSVCFYRYANIDFRQLQTNLQGDRELALSGVRTFLKSFIMSIPKAKQNSTAAQNLPSFVMIVVRDKGLVSLANAFLRPVDGRKAAIASLVDNQGTRTPWPEWLPRCRGSRVALAGLRGR
jgi:CRISPR system Cascade subunit CasC